jgi:cell fate (sporulation/competence/biofilm development) regulator YlbF (YheA/YmcA/DUF963 family)
MANLELNELEIAPQSVVLQAACDFAEALAATGPFRTFGKADRMLRGDQVAQKVIAAYQSKQQSMRMALMLNSASAEDRAELERLEHAFLHEPAVAAYLQAQTDVMALFRVAGDQLSRHIGLSFTAACSSGCC